MKNTKKLSLMLTAILLASALAFCTPRGTAADTVISTSPDPVEKGPSDYNSTFELSVMITDVVDLWGFDFNITWDNSLISCVGNDSASLDHIWPGGWTRANYGNGSGWYKLAIASTSAGYTNVSSHDIFKIRFRAKGPICNSVRETTIGFATHKLSNSVPAMITHTVEEGLYRMTGNKPTLGTSPTTWTCRKYGETFDLTFSVSNAENVKSLEFDIRFNTTLLNYTTVVWGTWGSGTIVPNEASGQLTGSTSGAAKSGSVTLMTITLKASLEHIWKDEVSMSWLNNQTGTIFYQAANLTYDIAPKLRYTKGGLDEITISPAEVSYKFAPIKADIDNNGVVEVDDLTYLAHYYDAKEGDADWDVAEQYNLVDMWVDTPPPAHYDRVIDIFDVVVFGSNFGYTYTPP